ncbi:peptidase domain-containing ABC transporter [Priestia megaterium]|uniref:peptidase domain-containing ABC transporter n=1 Tax=Priestia megaterium TaxID=1404 RepID=UPI00077D6F90|nr:peptidase domain-containing ABC transporter [Priestia megaterium]
MIKSRNRRYRIPFIEQMEQSECGLCCLAMILSYYKSEYTLWELRDNWGGGREGINLLIIKKIAESLNLETAAQRVSAKNLDKIQLPAILHWQGNHFVVIEKIHNNNIHIVDPAMGRRVINLEEMNINQEFICLSIQPTTDLKRRKIKKVWHEYIKFLMKEPRLVSFIILFSLCVQLLAIVTPMSVQFIVDNVIMKEDNYNFTGILPIALILLVALQFIFFLLRARTLVYLQNRLDWNLMERFFSSLLKLPFHFFQMRSSGDLILRANSNMIVREILSTRTVTMLLDGGLIICFLFYMFYKSPYLSIYVVAIGIIQVALMLIGNRYTSRLSQEEILKQTKASSYLAEVLRGILVVKSVGVESRVHNEWANMFLEQIKASKRRGIFSAYVDSVMQSLRIAAPLIVLLIGAQEVISKNMSIGSMLAFYTLSISFFTPLTSLVTTSNQMVLMGTYFRRILDILEATPEQNDELVVSPPELQGEIELKNVSFKYNQYGPTIVRNVSLKVHPGQFIAIVGTTGSGKSTLASLLLGLYQPTEGQILFDKQDIKYMDKSKFRQQIGVVTQQIHLFNKSIFQNIAFHNENLTSREIIESAKLAEIHEDIMGLRMNYETVLSEEGSNLSGGQRQRLALARALVNKPKILLLDEASSALDTVTEQKIHQNLEKLNCTRIVIAHRLSTVKKADKIIVVDNGEIIETGSHEELLDLGREYRNLYENQLTKRTMEVSR